MFSIFLRSSGNEMDKDDAILMLMIEILQSRRIGISKS